MKKMIYLSGRIVEYQLVRKKVKNMNLRIKSDGSVHLSVPNGVKNESIERFLLINSQFILKNLERFEEKKKNTPMPVNYFDGELITLFGKKIPLCLSQSKKNGVEYQNGALMLSVKDTDDLELKKRTLEKYLREVCREVIDGICQRYYPLFKNYQPCFPEIKYRRMVSKWGSCNKTEGVLTFNYGLVHAPVSCIEYVVIHEFTHFIHPDHSDKFYSSLTKLMPDWSERKKLLDKVYIRKD